MCSMLVVWRRLSLTKLCRPQITEPDRPQSDVAEAVAYSLIRVEKSANVDVAQQPLAEDTQADRGQTHRTLDTGKTAENETSRSISPEKPAAPKRVRRTRPKQIPIEEAALPISNVSPACEMRDGYVEPDDNHSNGLSIKSPEKRVAENPQNLNAVLAASNKRIYEDAVDAPASPVKRRAVEGSPRRQPLTQLTPTHAKNNINVQSRGADRPFAKPRGRNAMHPHGNSPSASPTRRRSARLSQRSPEKGGPSSTR